MERFSYSELYHTGILGMKWGRRRYQYEDGTLTPEGRERYGRGGRRRRIGRNGEVRYYANPYSVESDFNPAKKRRETAENLMDMTDDEVKRASERIDMENKFLDNVDKNRQNIGKVSVTKYMDVLKDVKDVTGIIRGITTDISGSVNDITNISINNAKRSNPYLAAFPKGDKKKDDKDDEDERKKTTTSSTI